LKDLSRPDEWEILTAKWQEIARRFNNVGFCGVSVGWVPPVPEVNIARKAIRYLEDRRMLFNDCCNESPSHCAASALEIREFLTLLLGDLDDKSALRNHLSLIRRACRKFLDRTQGFQYADHRWRHEFSMAEQVFFIQLGETRSAIGLQVALMAVAWQIDVEGDLARVLPELSDDDLSNVLRSATPA
jgi:hypothetical protein